MSLVANRPGTPLPRRSLPTTSSGPFLAVSTAIAVIKGSQRLPRSKQSQTLFFPYLPPLCGSPKWDLSLKCRWHFWLHTSCFYFFALDKCIFTDYRQYFQCGKRVSTAEYAFSVSERFNVFSEATIRNTWMLSGWAIGYLHRTCCRAGPERDTAVQQFSSDFLG